jgi:hypothetical protein
MRLTQESKSTLRSCMRAVFAPVNGGEFRALLQAMDLAAHTR